MRILIVDDSSTAVALLQVFLVGRETEIRVARDGLEGLRIAREMLPDVVVTDLIMPRMDGWELCAAIRADPDLRGVAIVAMTTRTDPQTRLRATLAGADAVVTKPASPEVLRRTVESLTGAAYEREVAVR
jgi:CheY-like chemotaxis protein